MVALSKRSLDNLKGVHPDLVRVVMAAAKASDIDFMVTEGRRSVERQKQLVAKGASQTMNSRHISGHAVDVAPVVAGQPRWDWPLIFKLAESFRRAAIDEKVPVRWGGCWDVRLNNMKGSPERESAGYVGRRKAQKRAAFTDGPHYELPSQIYP